MKRVFVDANVLFSAALLAAGRPEALFNLARLGGAGLVATDYVVEEARRNLAKKAPHAITRFETLVPLIDIVPEPGLEIMAQAGRSGLAEKDVPVLAGAISAAVDILVTGDRKHFAALFGRYVGGVLVLSLEEGLDVASRAVG